MESANMLDLNRASVRFLLIAGVVLFAPYALLSIWSTLFSTMPLAFASIVGVWHFFVSWLLLANIQLYLLVCIGFIILSIAGLISGRSSRKQVAAFTVLLGMVLLFVFAPYRPAVTTAEGFSMVVPTQPGFFLHGLKNAQAVAEVTPCQFKLLGWQHETLFYQSECKNDEIRTWRFSPEEMKRPIEYLDALPPSLHTTTLSREETLSQLIVEDVYPKDAEYSVRSLYVSNPGMVSPDGKWLALISQHLYSVQDVILVKPE